MGDHLYATETGKSSAQFARDFGEVARKHGFVIHNESHMDMAHTFGEHGVAVAEGFDLHMIQVCKPDKSAKSLHINPERAILMPKYVVTFSRDKVTQVRFFYFSQENIRQLVDDKDYPASLAETYKKIISMIDEALVM
ncbi:MAG: DUF302 domain-containing protein [Desulfobulbaceae bacterium A2]|nr:MAG: DUF302 domain-containing protein [Desulfobulbaceae bacterium A2]